MITSTYTKTLQSTNNGCLFLPSRSTARNRPTNNKRSLGGYRVPETKEMMKENEENGRGEGGGAEVTNKSESGTRADVCVSGL